MPEFIIYKRGGGFHNIQSWKDYLNNIPDGRYLIKIENTKKRSLPQNAWLHAILPDILRGLRDVGYNEVKTTGDAKDVLKALFFKKEITNGSETIEVIERTSQQSTIDFASKAEEIIMWASQYLGIDIAPPEKQLEFLK